MKRTSSVVLGLVMVITFTVTQAMGAVVCGVTQTTQGVPVSGVSITARDSSGKVIGHTTTGKQGEYEIQNLGQGTLDLFLDPAGTGVQGGSGVLDLANASQLINWRVSNSSRAVASQGGPCPSLLGPLTSAEWAAIAVLGLGAAGGTAATAWGSTNSSSSSSQRVISSSF